MKQCNGVEIPETFKELVDNIYNNHDPKKITEKNLKNRRSFIDYTKKFHEEAGTLTSLVRERIERLEGENDCIFLLSAHQPNLMPYSGVIRKLALMEAVKRRLESLYSISVISLYSVSDETFPDRWVKTTQLPDLTRRKGRLDLSNSEIKKKPHHRLTGYGKYSIRISSIPRPSPEILAIWKGKIRNWIYDTLKSVRRRALKNAYTIADRETENLFRNAREFFEILDESYEQAGNYADFNAFLLSKIVNGVFNYSTLFVRYSESQHILKDEISFLVFNYQDYFEALKEAKSRVRGTIIDMKLAPFWHHCACGGLANLLVQDLSYPSYYSGECTNCETNYRFSFLDIILESSSFFSNISLRAIPFLLTYSKGLRPDLFVGGMGGLRNYYPEAKIVADRLKVELPLIGIWDSHDLYAGIGQLEAFLASKGSPSLKVRRKISQVLEGKYSIADYAANIGLRGMSQQWLDYLLNDGADLTSNVYLSSVFDGNLTEDFVEFVKERSSIDQVNETTEGALNSKDKKIVRDFFESRLKNYSENHKILGYGCKESQAARFKVVTEIGDLRGKSILDYGCGLGDLVDHLEKQGIGVTYTGYDISEKLIKRAQELHPNHNFEVRDILEDMPDQRFSYVFAIGLNLKVTDNVHFIKTLIKRLFDVAEDGVSVSLLSCYSDYFAEESFYHNPALLVDWCLANVSRRCVLRHDYLSHDFTLYIYKNKPDKRE